MVIVRAGYSLCAPAGAQSDRAHRRSLGTDQLQRQPDQREAILGDAVEVLEIGHGDDAMLAQRPRVVEDAGRIGLIIAVIEIVADDHDPFVDAPHRGVDGQIRGLLHPRLRATVIAVVQVGAQQQPIALADAAPDGALEVLGGDRLAGQLVAQIGDDGVAHEQLERKLVDLRAAPHVVLRRIDVAAGMQPHMHPAHDLPCPARRVVLLEDFHLELHVPLEPRRRAHRKILWVELEADVDDRLGVQQHGRVPIFSQGRAAADPTGRCTWRRRENKPSRE